MCRSILEIRRPIPGKLPSNTLTLRIITGERSSYHAVVRVHVDIFEPSIRTRVEFIRTGKLVPLSVSSAQRSMALPDVPTSIEAGYPDSDLNFWIGIFAPAGTPRDIVARLSREIGIALADPAVREKLTNQGVDPMTMGAEEFQTFVNVESVSMAELAKALNLKPQ